MESALRPREIQARIRSGESLDDVAQAAGVPSEQIEVYAAPVVAEREHVATVALTSSARRRGETSGHRNLRSIVNERLMARGVDIDTAEWDAWKRPDRRWTLAGRYAVDGEARDARFVFDLPGRFSVADNDEARWLLGELSTAQSEARAGRDSDAEPTVDLDDEFALVRSTQSPAPAPATSPAPEPAPQHQPTPTQPDDVYDVLPAPESELDVLYDMLGGFNEDSVNIYAGLNEPVTEDAPRAERAPEPEPTEEPKPEPEPTPEPAPKPASERRRRRRPAPEAAPAEPEQPSLVDDDAPAPPAPKPTKRKRASVPSWDEIMFGPSDHQ